MKNIYTVKYSILIIGILLSLIISCKKEEIVPDYASTVTDIDGNVYKTIKIGTQVWMAENLKTSHFRNGDPILKEENSTKWANLITGAYCENPNSVFLTTGYFYNFYAIEDIRNIAPAGWHVPSDSEWTTLLDFLGGPNGSTFPSEVMKSKTGWDDQGYIFGYLISGNGTNQSGFNGFPCGYRDSLGVYRNTGKNAYWWSQNNILNCFFTNNNYYTGRSYFHPNSGLSLRCIMD